MASSCQGVSKYIKAGDYEKAIKFASSVSTPLAKVVLAVLQNRGKGRKNVGKAVDEVFLTEAPKITRIIPLLSMFANLATLIGLSATVYGVMVDFDAIANVPVAQRAQALRPVFQLLCRERFLVLWSRFHVCLLPDFLLPEQMELLKKWMKNRQN